MALDMALLRKLAAEKARTGKQPPAKGGKEPPEPPEPEMGGKEAPGKPGSVPAVNPFVAAAAKAKERLLAAK